MGVATSGEQAVCVCKARVRGVGAFECKLITMVIEDRPINLGWFRITEYSI